MVKNFKELAVTLWVQAGVITVIFGGMYFFLRSLPGTECRLLHMDYVGETADGSEFCGDSSAVFIETEKVRFPVTMTVRADTPIVLGHECFFTATFTTESGRSLGPEDLAIVHEKKMHLLVIDPSLEDYHHLHPTPMGPDGPWGFSFTPQASGDYRIYADLVPVIARSQIVCSGAIEVPGAVAEPVTGERLEATAAGFSFVAEFLSGPPVLTVENDIALTVTAPDGEPVALEKIMGAYAHMVAFDAGHKGFAHMHPLDEGVGVGTASPRFGFAFSTHIPGHYRLWAQLKIAGAEVFAPFDIVVK